MEQFALLLWCFCRRRDVDIDRFGSFLPGLSADRSEHLRAVKELVWTLPGRLALEFCSAGRSRFFVRLGAVASSRFSIAAPVSEELWFALLICLLDGNALLV